MHEFLSKLSVQPDIIALTETKLSGNSVYSNIELNGYDFLHADSETLAGGVGLYIQNKLDYSVPYILAYKSHHRVGRAISFVLNKFNLELTRT